MQLVAHESNALDEQTHEALLQLWADAFGDHFSEDDADHAFGGVHVLARDAGRIVGHASAVPRRIRFGDQPWCTIGYVEAVATAPGRQRQGIGRAVMQRLHAEMRGRWPVAMLSTGQATGFYERLGWERWRGSSFTRTPEGDVPDGEHGGLMLLRLDSAYLVDVAVDVTCEDRSGDAW